MLLYIIKNCATHSGLVYRMRNLALPLIRRPGKRRNGSQPIRDHRQGVKPAGFDRSIPAPVSPKNDRNVWKTVQPGKVNYRQGAKATVGSGAGESSKPTPHKTEEVAFGHGQSGSRPTAGNTRGGLPLSPMQPLTFPEAGDPHTRPLPSCA